MGFLIVDTEQGEGGTIYDLAFCLTDRRGTVTASMGALMRPLPEVDRFWPPHKVAKYNQSPCWSDAGWDEVRSIIDLNPTLVGFNLTFDRSAIMTDLSIPYDVRKDLMFLNVLDLRFAALASLGIQVNYPRSVTGRTDRGSVRSRLSDFAQWRNLGITAHTATADCLQSAQLLKLVLRQKRKLPYGVLTQAEFCQWGKV
jgi:hypothetical protein